MAASGPVGRRRWDGSPSRLPHWPAAVGSVGGAQIVSLGEQWAAAWSRHDVDGLAQLFTDDASTRMSRLTSSIEVMRESASGQPGFSVARPGTISGRPRQSGIDPMAMQARPRADDPGRGGRAAPEEQAEATSEGGEAEAETACATGALAVGDRSVAATRSAKGCEGRVGERHLPIARHRVPHALPVAAAARLPRDGGPGARQASICRTAQTSEAAAQYRCGPQAGTDREEPRHRPRARHSDPTRVPAGGEYSRSEYDPISQRVDARGVDRERRARGWNDRLPPNCGAHMSDLAGTTFSVSGFGPCRLAFAPTRDTERAMSQVSHSGAAASMP
jgi:hypothetical protein